MSGDARWPDGSWVKYLTRAGLTDGRTTVDVRREFGGLFSWTCSGCLDGLPSVYSGESARQTAQRHADTCTAQAPLPVPEPGDDPDDIGPHPFRAMATTPGRCVDCVQVQDHAIHRMPDDQPPHVFRTLRGSPDCCRKCYRGMDADVHNT